MLPSVVPRVPCPAGQSFEPVLLIVAQSGFIGLPGVPRSLRAHPDTQLVTISVSVSKRNTSITIPLDVGLKSAEALFPPIDEGVPCPTRQSFEPMLTVGAKDSFGTEITLPADPPSEWTIADHIGVSPIRPRNTSVTVLLDVGLKSAEILLPLISAPIPCPARQLFKSFRTIGGNDVLRLILTLNSYPRAKPVSADLVGVRDASVTVAFDILLESAETLLELFVEGIPRPTRQVPKSAFTLSVKNAPRVKGALVRDPLTELVAIDGVGRRDAGVTVEFDVVLESAEVLLPLVGVDVPRLAGQFLEPAFAVGVKCAVGVEVALLVDPETEPVTIDRVQVRDARVGVAFDELFQQPEPELP